MKDMQARADIARLEKIVMDQQTVIALLLGWQGVEVRDVPAHSELRKVAAGKGGPR
jgi:hypothetical protein